MLYIVRFGPYCPHDFVPSDASPLLSLTPQNVYNMLATSTTNKVSYQTLTRQCEILQKPKSIQHKKCLETSSNIHEQARNVTRGHHLQD
jgi:hypothetical protein